MLDVKMVRTNPDEVRKALLRRGDPTSSLDEFLAVEVAPAPAAHRSRKPSLRAQAGKRRDRRRQEGRRRRRPGDRRHARPRRPDQGARSGARRDGGAPRRHAPQLPNLVLPDVPDGGEEDSVVLRTVGTPRKFDFEPKDHLDLGLALDLIDMERAAKVSGSRFVYLKGDLVMLQFALVNYALTVVQSKGFRPVIPPCSCAKRRCTAPASSPPTGPRSTRRSTATASSAPARSRWRRCIWRSSSTRRRSRSATPATPCFRREAGAAGRDTRGILRVHQFDKVEMFSFCAPEQSAAEHQVILSAEEAILQGLGIPYQVVNIAAGDLGAPAAQKFDCEAWLPGQQRYRELTSCSNCTDYQARRLNTRFRTEKGPRSCTRSTAPAWPSAARSSPSWRTTSRPTAPSWCRTSCGRCWARTSSAPEAPADPVERREGGRASAAALSPWLRRYLTEPASSPCTK